VRGKKRVGEMIAEERTGEDEGRRDEGQNER
jgi:hypothetical protein